MKMNQYFIVLICFLVMEVSFYAFTPEGAGHVFEKISLSSETPYIEWDGYVFCFIKYNDSPDADSDSHEMEEMSAIASTLEKYLRPESMAASLKLPFNEKLGSWFVPSSDALNFNFSNVASCILKNEESGGKHCLVMAFDAEPLRKEKARIAAEYKAKIGAMKTRTEAEWGKALADVYNTHFKDREGKRIFFFNLGCPIVSWLDPEISVGKDELLKCGDKASEELLKLLDWAPPKGSVFEQYPGLTWTSQQKGGSGVFFPRWEGDDGGAFDEAVKLYKKGKDIPRIIALLAKSISASPVGTEKWQYLGGVLMADGKYQDTVIAYLQSLRQDSSNRYSWKGLATALDKAGYPENAKGLAWYLRMQGILK